MKLSTKRRLKIAGGVVAAAGVLYGIAIAAGLEDEASVENQVFIDRPPEVVFDYISDMRHELEWNPDLVYMRKVTDGPIGLGTRFEAKWKQSGDLVVEVTKFDPPRAWTAENGGVLETRVEATIAPEGNGSRFVSRFTARPHGFMKVVFPIFKLSMASFEKANMAHLKKALESKS